MITPIYKTAVTSKITIREIVNAEICQTYEESLDTKNLFRIDLPPEVSTILGCRYLDDQLFDVINIYRRYDKFIMSFEPLPFDAASYQSEIFFRHINSNPKSNNFNQDDCGQFIVVPKEMFNEGEYETEIFNDTEETPRHMVCSKIQ